MKVDIGPYKDWIGPYQIADKIFFWVNRRGIYVDEPKIHKRWDYRAAEKFGDWLADTWINDFCNWIHNKKKRKVKIKLHNYDSWSADHTLALIIHPLLVQLNATKHGSPFVDDEDVPDELKSTAAPPKENEWDTDDNHHKRWEWVLNEMVWAFGQHIDDEAEDQFHKGKHDMLWQKVDLDGNKVGDPVPLGKKEKNEDDYDDEGKAKFLYQMVTGPNDTHEYDREGHKKWQERKANGFRLFGKYYQALWD